VNFFFLKPTPEPVVTGQAASATASGPNYEQRFK
jgi:hypothetical protein